MKKVKVAHIITRMIIGGAQENTLYTVEGLRQDPKYEVDLISGPTYGPEGDLLRDSKNSLDIKLIPALRRSINPFYDIVALVHLIRTLRKGRYDIVHTHSAKAGILGRLAAKICGVPVVIHTIHGLAFHRYQHPIVNRLYIFLEKFVSSFSNKVITVCDDMIRQCLDVRIAPEEKFQTIYSGLDIESFTKNREEDAKQLCKELGLPPETFVIGKVGRLFHLKGHEYLLEAARKVIQEVPHARFLFVGGGVLEEALKEKAREFDIEENVIFTGLVSTAEVPIFLKIMDMVVHVSLREGLPRVIPQAYLSEKPVVAFDIDGARDIITDGINGYLVEPKNTSDLAQKILTVIHSKELREQFVHAGKAFALHHFSKEKMVDEIDKLYQKLGDGSVFPEEKSSAGSFPLEKAETFPKPYPVQK